MSLDKGLLHLINNSWSHPWLDVVFPSITDLHKVLWFQVSTIALLLWLFVKKFKKQGLIIFLHLVLAVGFSDLFGNHALKKIVQRARPGDVAENSVIVRSSYGGFSFVSNHSTNMFCLAKFTSEFIPQLKIPLFAIAVTIGYSRVYNGVHYPTDVLAGALLGYLMATLFSRLCRYSLARFEKGKQR